MRFSLNESYINNKHFKEIIFKELSYTIFAWIKAKICNISNLKSRR